MIQKIELKRDFPHNFDVRSLSNDQVYFLLRWVFDNYPRYSFEYHVDHSTQTLTIGFRDEKNSKSMLDVTRRFAFLSKLTYNVAIDLPGVE